jgi:hypothetical protein
LCVPAAVGRDHCRAPAAGDVDIVDRIDRGEVVNLVAAVEPVEDPRPQLPAVRRDLHRHPVGIVGGAVVGTDRDHVAERIQQTDNPGLERVPGFFVCGCSRTR